MSGKHKGVGRRRREWQARKDWSCCHGQGTHFFWLNESLLICSTLTFLHFTPHLLHIMLLGAGSCMFPSHCELSDSLRLLQAYPPSYVNLLGLQCAAHLNGNSCNTWFCIDPCKETPRTSPSTGRSGSAAEQHSLSWQGFSFSLKDTWDRQMFTDTVLVF